MINIAIDTSKIIKKIKPMHGGGQPPLAGSSDRYFHYLTEAGVPFSRLHDVGGPFGSYRFVDVPNIFRDFDADENDPANYDFAFTDVLIKGLIDAGVEPYYRLGTTIENDPHVKTYRIHPPKDFEKWARICEHIIAHYTEGWADGFHYNIRYWEIWNEPEVTNGVTGLPMMWTGTYEEFYRFYEVAAKHLKKRFPNLKIGGYASCGFYAIAPDKNNTPPSNSDQNNMTFFYGFFDYIKKTNTPIDFFSWHSYAETDRIAVADKWLHNKLIEYGYPDLETHLNEWNPNFGRDFGTAIHCAETASTMLAMQNGFTDILCIYDIRIVNVPFNAIFDAATKKPSHTYYAFAAFNRLYTLGEQCYHSCDTEGVYAVCATDGEKGALMISNISGNSAELNISGVELKNARYYVIDDEHLLSWAPHAKYIDNNSVYLIEFDL